jgi:hypothetical protein
MKACNRVISGSDKACNIPASFDESALARTGGTVELPMDTSDRKVLEPLLESSETSCSPSSPHANNFSPCVPDKFYLVTQAIIDNIASQNLSAEFPLVLSGEELRIVKNYKTSTLILGRSGTGKTTCLVYKLVGRYLASNFLHPGRPRRQVRITSLAV